MTRPAKDRQVSPIQRIKSITKQQNQTVVIIPDWISNKILPVVNIILEVSVIEEKKWSYTREEEIISEEQEEAYEAYEEYEDYKPLEEYEPTEEYDQYEDYEEREFEHYEEYVTGRSKTINPKPHDICADSIRTK